MKHPSLEQTIMDKLDGAKATVQDKLFKQFVLNKDEGIRSSIGAKMNVLDDVIFALKKEIRGNTD